MLDPIGERTLISAIIPPSVAHINGVQSITFENTYDMVFAGFFMSSVIADFYIKSTERTNLHHSWENLPWFTISTREVVRILILVCLTNHYAGFWNQLWCKKFKHENWAKKDSRLSDSFFDKLTPQWTRACSIRTDYARRQVLIEIDVLSSMALGQLFSNNNGLTY